ncbi:polysaccharide biosynthesis protein [Phocaeicola plebeius DSM 17135]|uniref:Polysaccharide biosynthesis protein n=1 Tax=Phocaeicola plebeius (strain DSM 17135 / JCM 12973 / CCUG 54634 / M2) TaxID=484018 RepID=B5CWR8_PHOPM|nr:lipopolysaccharide biosynthesis protein [Phocaeicola plebeius]EDY96715.1 polysaccharide biosynthesis protein [Phocaeicola plebeius DSM 17135]
MSIKQEMINGVFWTALQKYSGLIIQIIVTAILARLLSPEDFGVVAVSTVLIAFFTLFTDMGIGPAIIQKQDLTKEDFNSIFSFTIWGGLILAILFFITSYPIGIFYKKDSLVLICQILSINLLFAAWNIVPNALINKNKRFKFIAKRTLTLQVISGIISVFSAFNGLGIYSLLISPILTAVGVFILNYKEYPLEFKLHIHTNSLKKIFSYSSYQFLFNFINYFSRNLDKLIIGRYFSMHDLGYYEKSYRLMMLPLQYVTNIITPVMHPILTSLQNDYKNLTDKYNSIIKLLATISFPLGIFLYFAANDIIYIVYGNRWENAIPVFQILALSLPLQMILSTTGAIYQAAGKTNWLFYGGVSNTCFTVLGFIIASVYFKTIEAMAWAWDITLFFNTIISYFVLYKIVLKQRLREVIKICISPTISAILIILVLAIIPSNIPNNHLIQLIIKFSVSFIVCIIFIQLTKQYNLIQGYKKIKQ